MFVCLFFSINYLETVLALKNIFFDEKYVDKNKSCHMKNFRLIVHVLVIPSDCHLSDESENTLLS